MRDNIYEYYDNAIDTDDGGWSVDNDVSQQVIYLENLRTQIETDLYNIWICVVLPYLKEYGVILNKLDDWSVSEFISFCMEFSPAYRICQERLAELQ